MAEHGVQGPVLGVAYDGTGFGEDGTSWGGEFLLCSAERYERLATFRPLRLAGGDLAMREVWRIGYALLHDAYDGAPPSESISLLGDVSSESIRVVKQMIERELNAPQARGVGRYFDGFGALALGRARSTYEGQIAIAWDQVANESVVDAYPFEVDRMRTPWEVDLRPAVRAAVDDLRAGAPAGDVSARFHNAVVGGHGTAAGGHSGRAGRHARGPDGRCFPERLARRRSSAPNVNEINVLRHQRSSAGRRRNRPRSGLDRGRHSGRQRLMPEGAFPCA